MTLGSVAYLCAKRAWLAWYPENADLAPVYASLRRMGHTAIAAWRLTWGEMIKLG